LRKALLEGGYGMMISHRIHSLKEAKEIHVTQIRHSLKETREQQISTKGTP
jgi:hypothetical protein